MDQATNHPAVQALQSFFAEMHAWEIEADRHHRAINWDTVTQAELKADQAARRKELERIFETYCEVGTKAKRLKGQGISFRNPPEYDPEKELILSVEAKGKKLIVETKQTTGFKWKKRYELVERDGRWKIRDNSKYGHGPDASTKWSAGRL